MITQVRQQSEGEVLCWGDYELFKIRWSLIIQDLVFKEQDFELNSGFKRQPVKRSRYGRNMLCCSSPCQHSRCRISGGLSGFSFTQQELVSDLKSAGTTVTRTTTGNLSVVSTVFGMNSGPWWRRNAEYDPKNATPTVKNRDGDIVLADCFSFKGKEQLHCSEGPMSKATCCKILKVLGKPPSLSQNTEDGSFPS